MKRWENHVYLQLRPGELTIFKIDAYGHYEIDSVWTDLEECLDRMYYLRTTNKDRWVEPKEELKENLANFLKNNN